MPVCPAALYFCSTTMVWNYFIAVQRNTCPYPYPLLREQCCNPSYETSFADHQWERVFLFDLPVLSVSLGFDLLSLTCCSIKINNGSMGGSKIVAIGAGVWCMRSKEKRAHCTCATHVLWSWMTLSSQSSPACQWSPLDSPVNGRIVGLSFSCKLTAERSGFWQSAESITF